MATAKTRNPNRPNRRVVSGSAGNYQPVQVWSANLAAALWSDREYFESVHALDGGGVSWEDERYDMSPLVLYMLVTGKPLDEVCPQVRYLD